MPSYDVENGVIVDAKLESSPADERSLGKAHPQALDGMGTERSEAGGRGKSKSSPAQPLAVDKTQRGLCDLEAHYAKQWVYKASGSDGFNRREGVEKQASSFALSTGAGLPPVMARPTYPHSGNIGAAGGAVTVSLIAGEEQVRYVTGMVYKVYEGGKLRVFGLTDGCKKPCDTKVTPAGHPVIRWRSASPDYENRISRQREPHLDAERSGGRIRGGVSCRPRYRPGRRTM